VTEQNADGNGYDHLEIQGFVQGLTSRHGKLSSRVPCDNIHLLSTTPQLRTLLHWRDLFCRLHAADLHRASQGPCHFSEMPYNPRRITLLFIHRRLNRWRRMADIRQDAVSHSWIWRISALPGSDALLPSPA
jgi:hypothetical protein